MPTLTDLVEAMTPIENARAERLWEHADAIRRQGPGGDQLPPFTVSGGVAQLRAGESLAELMRRADQATYQSKNGGRDQIRQAPGDHDEDVPGVVVPLRRPSRSPSEAS